MMRRKIIKQGNNSFTFTLPINWIREEKLDGGDEIEIEQEDNHLVIAIPKDLRRPESKISIELNEYNERTIRNILNQVYRKGYDQIILDFKNEQQLEEIKEIVRNTLLGFEVVDEKENKCTIQNIAEPSDEKFSVILRKIFFSIKSEAETVLNDFENGKLKNMKKLEQSKNALDNYTNFCRRLLIKNKIGGTKNSYLILMIVSRLSLIHHGYFYMYKFALKNKVKISKSVLRLLNETNKMFDVFYDSFYNVDLNEAHKVGLLKDRLINDDLYKLLQKSKGGENVLTYHMGEVIRIIHMCSTNIFGLTDLENLN